MENRGRFWIETHETREMGIERGISLIAKGYNQVPEIPECDYHHIFVDGQEKCFFFIKDSNDTELVTKLVKELHGLEIEHYKYHKL